MLGIQGIRNSAIFRTQRLSVHKTEGRIEMEENGSALPRGQRYAVGELFGIDFQGRELITYNYSQGGHHVTVALPNMIEREEQELRSGSPQFALTVESGIIFLLSKFGEMPWMDAPFHWWLNPPALRMTPPSVGPNERVLVAITAVDSVTNLVRVLRAVTPSHELSRALHEAIRRQARSSWKGEANYDRQLAKVYRQFTTPDLLSQAMVISNGTEEDKTTAAASKVASTETTASHVYAPYTNAGATAVPTEFSVEDFADFHQRYAIPVDAEDDDPIDFVRNARVGALKLQEVTVDGVPRVLWVVQPGYYSEDFGLELPE